MNEISDKVRNLIRNLLARTVANGCTEAEAMAAAGKVGALMEQYAINVSDLEIREQKCITVSIEVGKRHPPIYGAVGTIAAFCDIKWWFVTCRGYPITYKFFGLPDDAALAGYLFDLIRRAMDAEVAAFKKTQTYRDQRGQAEKRRASDSFQYGMAARIKGRLIEMKRARDATVAAQRTTGTSIVIVKNAVVAEQYAALGMKVTSVSRTTTVRDIGAYSAGMKAGERVNLNRPLAAGQDTRRIA